METLDRGRGVYIEELLETFLVEWKPVPWFDIRLCALP